MREAQKCAPGNAPTEVGALPGNAGWITTNRSYTGVDYEPPLGSFAATLLNVALALVPIA